MTTTRCLLALLLTTRIAAADPVAEKLFRDAKALLADGKIDDACELLARSDQLEPRIGTVLNLADCRERQGRTATAWKLFLETRARAAAANDPRADTATERATALEPQLAYLTVEIDRPIEGLVIRRNGVVVSPTALNAAVPLDPGNYQIEASAPRHEPWTTTQPLAPNAHITVAVAPLVEVAAPRGDVIAQPTALGPLPKRRPFAIGLALGVAAGTTSSAPASNEEVLKDDNIPVGLRLLGSLPVPHGAVRAVASVLYTKGLNDETDSTNWKKLYVIGVGADYVWMPRPQLAFAVGIGAGVDYEVRAFDQGTDTARWTMLRASPFIVRLMDGHVEIGAHLQVIRRGEETGFIGLAAIDVFPI